MNTMILKEAVKSKRCKRCKQDLEPAIVDIPHYAPNGRCEEKLCKPRKFPFWHLGEKMYLVPPTLTEAKRLRDWINKWIAWKEQQRND